MGYKNPIQLGHRRGPFKRRPGIARFPEFGGMYLQGDPGSCPPFRFRHLENVGFGDGIYARGGQEKLNAVALHDAAASVLSLMDHITIGDPFRLYVAIDGCPGISSTVGAAVCVLDPDQSPEFQRVVYYNNLGVGVAVAMMAFETSMYFGLAPDVKRFSLVQFRWGQEALGIGGTSQEVPRLTFPGFVVRCGVEFDGMLFLGLDAGAGASKIVTFDGRTVRDELTGINPPTAFGLWRDKIVVGFGLATNHIRYRSFGASPGTWTTVAPGAGTIASVYIVSYKDLLYITDGVDNVWSYDGTTLAVARNVVGVSGMRGLEQFNGFLFYGYQSTTPSAVIGRFDGTTWVDVHKDFAVQFPTLRIPRTLRRYRGALWAGINASIGNSAKIVRSPETTTSGTYTEHLPFATSVGDIDDMVTL